MNKQIQLDTDQYDSFLLIIKNIPDTDRLEVGINRKTYGGSISLKGTTEEIEFFCSFLNDNNIFTE